MTAEQPKPRKPRTPRAARRVRYESDWLGYEGLEQIIPASGWYAVYSEGGIHISYLQTVDLDKRDEAWHQKWNEQWEKLANQPRSYRPLVCWANIAGVIVGLETEAPVPPGIVVGGFPGNVHPAGEDDPGFLGYEYHPHTPPRDDGDTAAQ